MQPYQISAALYAEIDNLILKFKEMQDSLNSQNVLEEKDKVRGLPDNKT